MRIKEILFEDDPQQDNNANAKADSQSQSQPQPQTTNSDKKNNDSANEPTKELKPQTGDYTVDDSVKKLQSRLQKLGYDIGPPGVDGKFGPYTTAALSAFKKDYKLEKTGSFNQKDNSVMNKVLSGQRPKVKPTQPSPPQGVSSSGEKIPPVPGSAGGFKWKKGVDQRVKPDVLNRLMAVQKEFDISFVITSGYRSPARNKKAGGASKSAHMSGEAVDVKFSGSQDDTNRFIDIASRAGFGGIGVYRPGSVHLDVRGKRAWGPSFKFASVPGWAKGAINAHVS